MNLLFLSNPARGYYRFFNGLAAQFRNDGHGTFFAVDTPYSAYVNRLQETGAPVFDFSEFFAAHTIDRDLLAAYADCNLSAMLLPDFERGQVFGYWKRRDADYVDTLKSALLAFFTRLIDEHRIDAIVFENIAGAFAHAAWYVCQRKGVRYIGVTSTRLPGRFAIVDDPLRDHVPIEHALAQIQSGVRPVDQDVVAWSGRYLDEIDHATPDYMSFNKLDSLSLVTGLGLRERARVWWGALRAIPNKHEYAFGLGSPLRRRFENLRRALGRRWRARGLWRYYSEPREGERYLLYPLHYHPEASTSLLAGAYLNELDVVRNIAFNLPEGVKLYVKDHRSAYGFPPNAFYEALSRLPNVRVIEPFAQTKVLIRKSLAVITLTSTVGYEALLIGKRVFLYGTVFYQFHPDVVPIRDPARLFDLFREWLPAPLRGDRAYNEQFLQAYWSTTLPGVFNPAGPHAGELARTLYPAISDALKS